MLTDMHAHLGDASFDADRDEVLARAFQAGVSRVVAVAETLADAQRNLELGQRYPGQVLPAAGLYPTYLDLEHCAAMETLIRRHGDRLAMIGEVGLDRWKVKDEAELELQREIFERMIALSLELDLPLNVHSRSAGHHAIAVLLERGATRVQLHAFDGKASRAMVAVEAGYFFSVPPSVVRSQQKQKLVRRLPLECLLVETDSPVLGPTREERNEPKNAALSLQVIAELKGIALEEARVQVEENTRRLLGEAEEG